MPLLEGYLAAGALHQVARELRLPLSRVYGVASFYHLFRSSPPNRNRLVIAWAGRPQENSPEFPISPKDWPSQTVFRCWHRQPCHQPPGIGRGHLRADCFSAEIKCSPFAVGRQGPGDGLIMGGHQGPGFKGLDDPSKAKAATQLLAIGFKDGGGRFGRSHAPG